MLILSFIVLLYTCNFIQNFIKNIIRKIKVLEQYKKKMEERNIFFRIDICTTFEQLYPLYTHDIVIIFFFSLYCF